MSVTRTVLDRSAELRRRGEPFVLTTVVWSQGPSSGKRGSKAIIHADGRVEGWLGGACAEPSVVKEARAALADGEPRLMFIGPAEGLGRGQRDGVTTVPMACDSEGSLEVYLEPFLPQPLVVAVGRSPAVDTLARLARDVGWDAVVVDDGGSAHHHPGVDEVVTALDALADLPIDERSYVVVATQGHYDEIALRKALETRAGYVGLVASRKRADQVLEFLRTEGVSDAQLARVHAPAGVDLGRIEHTEMAVSILAELVAARASGAVVKGLSLTEPDTAVDPVCGMTVEIAGARFSTAFEDTTYYFCSAGCLRSFEANPSDYLAS